MSNIRLMHWEIRATMSLEFFEAPFPTQFPIYFFYTLPDLRKHQSVRQKITRPAATSTSGS
jgi:hypothetical protein